MKRSNFLIESLKHWPTIGAVAACSPVSARKMVQPVDFSRARIIVELGGGTGAVTREILARMRPDAELTVFEIHPVFAEMLAQIRDSRLTVVHDSAANLGRYMEDCGMESADAVISTLPIAIMDPRVRTAVFREVHRALAPRGRYVQIQYSLISRREIEHVFPHMRLDFTPFNIPPAFFYICEPR